MYGPVMEQLGLRAGTYPDTLLFTLINAAESTDCFDGQYFFDTDHSWGDSGTQSNDLTYNASDPTAVTAAECKLAYNAAVLALTELKDDQGEYRNGSIYDESQQLLIVCNGALLQAFRDALTVKTITTGGENYVLTQQNIIANARYTSTLTFDVYKIDEPLRPFVFQTRDPLKRQMKNQDDLEWKDVKFMTQA